MCLPGSISQDGGFNFGVMCWCLLDLDRACWIVLIESGGGMVGWMAEFEAWRPSSRDLSASAFEYARSKMPKAKKTLRAKSTDGGFHSEQSNRYCCNSRAMEK